MVLLYYPANQDRSKEGAGLMSDEAANKEVVTRLNAAIEAFFNGGDIEAVAACFADDCKFTQPGMPPNLEGMKEALPAFRAALSDFRVSMEEMVAEGDLVAYHLSWTAVHSGDFMGIPPTGNHVSMTESHFDRVQDGKVVEHGGDWDQLGLMQQIGAIPPMH
jgi:steroid delta-isomerase-like uncharacterized protein